MIKTIYSTNSLLELQTQTCGFVSRNIKKQLKGMKEVARKFGIPLMTLSQFTTDYEYDIFIIHPKIQHTKILNYKDVSVFDFETFVNAKIFRTYEPISHNEQSLNFPLLEAVTDRHNIIEVYFANEKMDLESKKFYGAMAKGIQSSTETLKGFPIIHPIRHKGSLKILSGYEDLFPNTFPFLEEFCGKCKESVFELTEEEKKHNKALNFISFKNISHIKAEDLREYQELRQRLKCDYLEIRARDDKENEKIAKDENLNRKAAFLRLIKNLDLP